VLEWEVSFVGLKLRASYILLAVSIVILATGIILITNHFTLDRTTETPVVTTLLDQTYVVPVGFAENARRLYFSIPSAGTLRVTVEVIRGGSIRYCLYEYEESSEHPWTVETGDTVLTSNFEVPLDTGRYYLIVYATPWQQDRIERTVHVCLEFES